MFGRLVVETLVVIVLCLAGAVAYYLCLHQEQPPDTAAGVAASFTVEDAERSVTHDGRQRRYLVHVPRGHDGTRPLPVVLGFHGGGGRAESFRTLSRLNEAADRHGFLVVYPEGTGRWRNILTFNAGRCCGYAMEHEIDDVGFVRALLDELPRRYAVDARRIYATGMSNGAMLCYRLACELSERIAAIAPVAGAMAVDGPVPARPVPVLHVHGRRDTFAPFEGGKGPLGGTPHQPVPDTLAWWVKVNRCGTTPAEVTEGDAFRRERYLPPEGAPGAPVVLYLLPDGGHTWPGGVDLTEHLGTGPLIRSVEASTLMWEFFEQFRLP